jgi:hypothetical protein
VRKTYFDIHSQTLKDLPPQWTSILTDEDITRTAIAAYERHRHYHQNSYQQPRPKPFIGDACFLTPSDLEFLKVSVERCSRSGSFSSPCSSLRRSFVARDRSSKCRTRFPRREPWRNSHLPFNCREILISIVCTMSNLLILPQRITFPSSVDHPCPCIRTISFYPRTARLSKRRHRRQ